MNEKQRDRRDKLEQIRTLAEEIGRRKIELEHQEHRLTQLIYKIQTDTEF